MRAGTSYFALAGLTALMALHLAVSLPGQPEYLATHFGGGGEPNGWMSRGTYPVFAWGMWTLTVVSFWSARFLMSRLHDRWINLPNKDLWLAPERRAATIDHVGGAVEWMGFATLVGIIGVHQLVFQANLLPEPRLDEGRFLVGLLGYFALIAGWLIWFLRSLRRPPGS